MAGPRVAVVGAGAWGTTLARVVARSEPVTLLCHSPETAARIVATGRNEARLPGVDLPPGLVATADPASARGSDRPRDLRDPVCASAGDGRGVRAVSRARSGPAVGRQGTRRRNAPADERSGRRSGRRVAVSDRGVVGPEPCGRGRSQSARVGSRRGRRPCPGRTGSGAVSLDGASGSTSTRTSSASSCAARSRTSSPSRLVPPTRSASATTARPAS